MLARLCEEVGLDLATFQDHPYQPAFLDTWTLMSFVAAQTSSIRLAANVTNLPLRPPAVLARSVASLDLLSHGRVELGLGAGAFWDAIEAMGGRRLTPGEGVRALEEAIEVIRQSGTPSSAAEYGSTASSTGCMGAKRGPAPAHDVDIWLGAYKPRMLRLTGRVADGWLPSLGYLKPGDLAAGNAGDRRSRGQRPDVIRRRSDDCSTSTVSSPTADGLLQGSAEQWAEQLAELALDRRRQRVHPRQR